MSSPAIKKYYSGKGGIKILEYIIISIKLQENHIVVVKV